MDKENIQCEDLIFVVRNPEATNLNKVSCCNEWVFISHTSEEADSLDPLDVQYIIIKLVNKREIIDNLEKIVSEDICVICLDNIPHDKLVLPCGHKFHSDCITRWLLDCSFTCPVCKNNLEK